MTLQDLLVPFALVGALCFSIGYRCCSDMQRWRQARERKELGTAILKS